MGTYYTTGASRADIIRECTTESSHKCLAHTAKGEHLWAVFEYTKDGKPWRYVALFILHAHSTGWGYKPIDESMGPFATDCPIAYVDMVSEFPPQGSAEEWRRKVRIANGRPAEHQPDLFGYASAPA